MSDRNCEPLSSAGVARREAMLDELNKVMERTHRNRRALRRIAATGGSACLMLLLIRLAFPGTSNPTDTPRIVEDATGAPGVVEPVESAQRRGCVTVIVQTDESILERYRAKPTSRTVLMDDRMLVQTLASIDRPAGVIRFGDTIRLTGPVTDAELGLKQ